MLVLAIWYLPFDDVTAVSDVLLSTGDVQVITNTNPRIPHMI